jgi:hypothetical protein
MLEWLRKPLLAAGTSASAPVMDPAYAELLREDLTALNAVVPESGNRALRFVLENTGESVLLELGGVKGGGSVLGLDCCEQTSVAAGKRRTRRGAFFAGVTATDPSVFLRLGRVYEAASRQEPRRLKHPLLQNGLEWLEILLSEATQWTCRSWPARCVAPAIPIEDFEALLTLERHPADLLVRCTLDCETNQPYCNDTGNNMFMCLKGFGPSLLRHHQTLLQALNDSDFNQRILALHVLSVSGEPCDLFADKLVDLAISSSRKVREQAEPLLRAMPDKAGALLRDRAAARPTDEREQAVRLLWRLGGDAARPFLTQRLREEKSEKLRDVMQLLLDGTPAPRDPAAPEAAHAATFALPPLPPLVLDAPLGAGVRAAFMAYLDSCHIKACQRHKEWRANWKDSDETKGPDPISAQAADTAFQLLQRMEDASGAERFLTHRWSCYPLKETEPFLAHPDLTLVHAVRLLFLLGGIKLQDGQAKVERWFGIFLQRYRRHHAPAFDLRELASVLAAHGVDSRMLGREMLECWQRDPLWLEDPCLWPYFAEHLSLLEEVFGLCPADPSTPGYLLSVRRKWAFEALQAFPQLPSQFVPVIWEIALGSSKQERECAQRCLARAEGKERRIMAALKSGQQDVRAAAAEWLGNLACKDAVPDLIAALAKEKSEAVKHAILITLETLQVPVSQFLDRGKLLQDATQGIAKGVPAPLAWFPFQTLPPVHWADTGELVSPEIIKWFLLQSHKLNSPEPGPLLRRYSSYWVAREREQLGQYVLESWLAQDTLPKYTAEQAAALAEQQVPQGIPDYEQHYRRVLNGLRDMCAGSASDSKGVLAVAGACCGDPAAPSAARFLKKWYGQRAQQCKALVRMLLWIEHPAAAQLLLSVGERFRTKGIREEADQCARLLAERKGWTHAELGDRTIPTAGFDETGRMEINYGIRTFTAVLQKDLSLVLLNPNGAEISSLPDAGKEEDEGAVKEAKRLFTAARKELKSIAQLQMERLYEAMCTQRSWSFADWNSYINRHPVVRFHVQRLIWVAKLQDREDITFRPLEDGSLTDTQDEAVQLPDDAPIRLAHDCTVAEPMRQAWLQHLSDYQVEPLFQQFGKGTYTLPDPLRQETTIAEFNGHLLEAFKLRSKATKLGYNRGASEDGGWFYTYQKCFSSLSLQAIVEFSGNPLPEENRTVALRGLRFEPLQQAATPQYDEPGIPLATIPPVLLAECRNDLRLMAAEGKGFDPAWETKVER